MGRSGDSAGEVWDDSKSSHQNSAQVSRVYFLLSPLPFAAPNVSFKLQKPTPVMFRVYAHAGVIDYDTKIMCNTEAFHSGARRKRAWLHDEDVLVTYPCALSKIYYDLVVSIAAKTSDDLANTLAGEI